MNVNTLKNVTQKTARTLYKSINPITYSECSKKQRYNRKGNYVLPIATHAQFLTQNWNGDTLRLSTQLDNIVEHYQGHH